MFIATYNADCIALAIDAGGDRADEEHKARGDLPARTGELLLHLAATTTTGIGAPLDAPFRGSTALPRAGPARACGRSTTWSRHSVRTPGSRSLMCEMPKEVATTELIAS